MRTAAAPTAVNKHSPHIIWPHGVRVALVGDEKQIGHEYVCRGSGSGGRLDGGGRGCALASTGDVGGAEYGLGGGARGGGRSSGTVGREVGTSGEGDADSDESS